ncbi:MAG: nitroreductase family protein [Halanaerobium sp.]
MEIPAERWYQAVKKRSSRRQFKSQIVEKFKIKKLSNLIEKINEEFEELRIVLVQKQVEEIFTGLLGSYGKISGAPAYLAFVGQKDAPRIKEKIGYGGEAVILEATALELGSCWVSGTFKADKVKSDLDLKEKEKLYAISPLGYPEEKPTISERILKTVISSKNRIDLEKLIINKDNPEELPESIKTALEAARLAPSAVNRQPWRFKVGENKIIIELDSTAENEEKQKNLDCGIAMLHLEVGALKAGVKGHWQYLEGKEVAAFLMD